MALVLIAAVGRNGVIGQDGDLPWHLSGDLRRFKETTMGHALVMGRRTYESIGHPLPGRTTVVVTRRQGWDPGHSEVVVVGSIDEALAVAAASADTDVFVAGGAEVYRQTIGLVDRLIITEVDAEPEGDTFFPDVDWSRWTEVDRAAGDGFEVVTYTRT